MIIALNSNILFNSSYEEPSLVTTDLSYFMTKNTKIFFERFGIHACFILDKPEE